MENNLNHKGIEEYCKELCDHLLEEHFADHDVITGPQILELQQIRQINLFVMKNLLNEWRKETSKIQSPYFNYDAPEVKEAQKEFMNILSRNIAITRDNFTPLLEDAIKETLLLVFSPYDFYMHLINDPKKNGVSIKSLKRISKYVKINPNLLMALIAKAEDEDMEKLSRQEATKMLNDVFENIQESPEDIDVYFEKFSELLPLDESLVYGNATATAPPTPMAQQRELEHEEVNEKAAPINSRFESPTKTLNDQHANQEKSSIADRHKSQKIDSIRKNISINQRFMFINMLFDGDETSFNNTVSYLEECENKSDANSYLVENYPYWNTETEEVEEFLEIVNKKFN